MSSRPQEPVAPFPYDEEEVVLRNSGAGVTLAGTLTRPRTREWTTALLLLPGSGAQDRDEELCGHRPFRILADYLTRSGVIVLRLDDRGVGGSTGAKNECTHDDLLSDVRTALAYLARHEAVDPRRLCLLGHSEGAALAAAAAARLEGIAMVVLLGCPAGPGAAVVLEQAARISRLSGATGEEVAHEQRMNEAVFAILQQPLGRQAARAAVLPILAEHLRTWPGQPLGDAAIAEHAQTMADVVVAPAFRSFLSRDPAHDLEAVRCPVLALYGERDVQVPPATHLPRLRRALSVAGNHDVSALELPGLNHLFQSAETGAIEEYGLIEETIAPVVLERIAGWIAARSGGAGTLRR